MSTTTNYNLNKPDKGTKGWDIAVNNNFDIIDTEIKNRANDISTLNTTINNKADKTYVDAQNATLSNKLGNVANLTTDNKTDLVQAINEHETQINSNTVQLTGIPNQSYITEKAKTIDVNNALDLKLDKNGQISVSQIDKTKGLFDQTFLTPQLLQQIAGTTPINSVPDYQSLIPEQFAFGVLQGIKSKNLFNKDTAKANTYIDTNGNEASASGWYASNWIKVSPNTTYHKNVNNSAAFYDSNKAFISPLTTSGTNTITTPSNCYYTRLSIAPDRDINVVQLELGTVETSYESYKSKIDPSLIINNSLTKNMMNFNPIEGVLSKNLFDKSKATSGYYINYTDGNAEAVTGFYASDFITVQPSTSYAKNNNQQYAFYDNNKTYISGLANGTTFTTPSNSYYVRLTIENSIIDKFQLELGNVSTGYESFGYKISPDSIPSSMKGGVNYQNVLIVAKSGGAYSTITDALAAANDSATNPVLILVMPGVYIESLILVKRYVTIVGIDKENCILKTYTNDYYHPPVDLSANSNLKNLTIIADDDGTTTPVNGVNGLKAYAIHHDISNRYSEDASTQGIAIVENCRLISKHTSAIGIGMANNQTLKVKDCEIISSTTTGESSFRAHNYMLTGATNQRLLVDNCRISNINNFSPITIQDPNNSQPTGGHDNRDTVFSFRNNIFWNEVVGQSVAVTTDLAPQSGCISGYVKLGKDSFGNNISTLNA